MTSKIYLDNNASTPLDPNVLKVVIQDLSENYGNPASIHAQGQEARNRISKARSEVASYLGVKSNEIVFTSGGTESANLAIKGLFDGKKGHVITSNVEHTCVHKSVQQLENQGNEVTYLPVGLWGAVKPENVREAIRSDTKLIVLMAVNNETGVKTDIEAIAKISEEAGIPFIVDGVALLGKEQFSIPKGVSVMFFSGHKMHAPKGIGAVFIRSGIKVASLHVGGGQENLRRSGTENVSGIVGFAEAIKVLSQDGGKSFLEMAKLRDYFESCLKSHFSQVIINGQGPRVSNTSNVTFRGVDGETLLMNLDLAGVAVSHGSACSSGALEPSRILLNMGLPISEARSALRFSLSRFTTKQEIDAVVDILRRIVRN